MQFSLIFRELTYTLLIAKVYAHIRDQGHLHPRLEVRRLGL
jgi:hypothetical protein